MKDDRKKTPEVSANCRNLGDFYKLYFASQSEIYLAISEIAVGGDICLRQVLCKTVGDDALGVPQNLIKKARNISIFLAFLFGAGSPKEWANVPVSSGTFTRFVGRAYPEGDGKRRLKSFF